MAVDGLVGLQVVAFAAAMALVGEVLLWWFIYRKPEFKALKAGLEKATAKLEEAKDGAAANSKKREARLQKWKEETAKHVASNSLKSGVMVRGRSLRQEAPGTAAAAAGSPAGVAPLRCQGTLCHGGALKAPTPPGVCADDGAAGFQLQAAEHPLWRCGRGGAAAF